jgi:hypothetical protein
MKSPVSLDLSKGEPKAEEILMHALREVEHRDCMLVVFSIGDPWRILDWITFV